ncbi:hypothetical protein BGZ80_001206 [Entomortierella chlamydospora]|uniref:AB hydrolase-1 domain-containing protein n=1 Tax=Entomortierella chlamydospora TaxID=101097 RepID=A0A9P6MRU0_9FUNG|nr:hypothetical protein BGZ80_001206 [Entomortierella chlamydospora]
MPASHIDPASFEHKFALIQGHRYHYVEEGDPKGKPLLLVHGFPDLWYGWRHQIKYLAKLGYRVIAPDTLGYGQTDAPMELHKYGMKTVCAHLAALLDILEIPKVTIIGHDWGGAIVWRFGLYYPNRLHGIISICTPYNPPKKEFMSLEEIVKVLPEFEYQLTFANPSTIVKMNQNVDDVLGNIGTMGDMHAKDVKYMVEQYKLSGFRGPLNYYKTTRINFDDELGLRNNIDLPCWIILAENDPYLKPYMASKMKNYIPQLKMTSLNVGHFAMTEKPDEVNATLKQCLEDLESRKSRASL